MALRRFLPTLGALSFGDVRTMPWSLRIPSLGGICELSTTNESIAMNKIYKSFGMKPPKPRSMSPEAQRTREV